MRYITIGVKTEIPAVLQFLMWRMIDNIPVDRYYLQVFYLSRKNGIQKIVHTQEVPEYRKEYHIKIKNPVKCKIFVIDGVMMMNYEY